MTELDSQAVHTTRERGAYVLVIDLAGPLALDRTSLRPAVLAPGRYAYCGSAYGPGGLRARIGRHLRADKTLRWHVDRLTAAGCVTALTAVPGGNECDLFARILATAGAGIPVPGFGSSDCRRCPAHLASVSEDFDPRALARDTPNDVPAKPGRPARAATRAAARECLSSLPFS